MLRLGTEVVEAGIDAHDEYNKFANSLEPIDRAAVEPLDRAGRRTAANAASLRLLGAHDTAKRCVDLRNAINKEDLMRAAYELNEAYREDVTKNKTAEQPEPECR